MDQLDDPLEGFRSDLNRTDHLLKLIKSLREFGSVNINNLFDQDGAGESGQITKSLWDEAIHRRTDLPVLAGSLLLYMCGRFEYFAKSTVEIASEEIASHCLRFDQIPDKLQKELVCRTSEVVQKPNRFGYDRAQAQSLVLSLADNFRATGGLPGINSNVVSLTEANLRPEQLAELFKRIGLQNLLNRIGKQSKIQIHFETDDEKTAEKAVQARLNEIVDERNRIAHPTSSMAFPDPDQVLAHSSYF